jgi:hypothetical protein
MMIKLTGAVESSAGLGATESSAGSITGGSVNPGTNTAATGSDQPGLFLNFNQLHYLTQMVSSQTFSVISANGSSPSLPAVSSALPMYATSQVVTTQDPKEKRRHALIRDAQGRFVKRNPLPASQAPPLTIDQFTMEYIDNLAREISFTPESLADELCNNVINPFISSKSANPTLINFRINFFRNYFYPLMLSHIKQRMAGVHLDFQTLDAIILDTLKAIGIN